jgi:hypothetical protein
MFVRIELFGYLLELGKLATEESDTEEVESDTACEIPGSIPVDAYDAYEGAGTAYEHELPLGFHFREMALGDEDV